MVFIIPELWSIIKNFLIRKPKEKSFPPYVWIHIKDYMLQEYWMRKYSKVLDKLPKSRKFVYDERATLSFRGLPLIVYTSAAQSPQFAKEFETITFGKEDYPIVTYTIHSYPLSPGAISISRKIENFF